MPIVEVNGQELEFPDSMSQDAIKAVLRKKFPSQQTVEQGFDAGSGNAIAYGLTGGAVPFGNVITSGIGAGIAKAASPFTGEDRTLGELYDQAQADTFATQDANPGSTLAGNIAGIGTTIPLAFSKTLFGTQATTGARGALNAIPAGISQVDRFVRGGKVAKDAGRLAKAGSVALRGAKGAAVAAPVAGLYAAGETQGDRGDAFVSGAGMGAALGAALPVAGAGVSAIGSALPKVDDSLAQVGSLARKYNIPVSFDQLTGSRAIKNVQKISQELPFSGQEAFRDKQMSAFNRSIFKTVGIEADKFTPEVMDKAFSKVGKEFDVLGSGKTFQFGDDFLRKLDDLRNEAPSVYGRDAIDNFQSVVEKSLKEADGQGYIAGEKLNKLRANVNVLARKTNNNDTRALLHDFENILIDTMTGGNEAEKKALSLAKQRYKNLLAIEPLAAKSKAGNISPSQLSSRVSRIYGRQFTRGKAGDIGEIAEIGRQILPEIGGSDTAQKILYVGGALGGGYAEPVLTATALSGNRLMQSAVFRNQRLVDRLIKTAASGGNITMKEINALPPQDKNKVINAIMSAPISRSGVINEKVNK